MLQALAIGPRRIMGRPRTLVTALVGFLLVLAVPGAAVAEGLAVSPDGRRLARGVVTLTAAGERTSRIVVEEVAGIVAEASVVSRTVVLPFASYSEILWLDDDRIAASAPGVSAYEVVQLSTEARDRIELPASCDILYKRLSPDARSIAFVGSVTEDGARAHGLFVVEVATGRIRRLDARALKTAPAWSPDSRSVAIGGEPGYATAHPLVRIDVATGQSSETGAEGVGAAWSDCGRKIAFTTDAVRGGSWLQGVPVDGAVAVLDLESGDVVRVSPEPKRTESRVAGGYRPSISPDGAYVTFVWHRSSSSLGTDEERIETYLARTDGTESRRILPHAAEIVWRDESTLIWMDGERVGVLDPARLPGAASEAPAKPRGRFAVEGRVTDESGRAVEGAEVRVARGWGTLFPTAPVRTNAEGWYAVHFDVGMRMMNDDVSLQCAVVSVSKRGFYERNFARHGNLGMAFRKPDDRSRTASFAGIVYPGHPYRLDFVLSRAARLEGRLVDERGQPLAGLDVSIRGDILPPASSVLDVSETDAEGRFSFDGVPLQETRFRVRRGRREVFECTDPLPLGEAGVRRVELVLDGAEGALRLVRGD